ncbi:MAG: hypothetical protein IMZ46_09530 [Acidobacteria bacterium]|nr:hypothetical protein [Acidobacteriota bacterium]
MNSLEVLEVKDLLDQRARGRQLFQGGRQSGRRRPGMICHYLRKSYLDSRYLIIDRAEDQVGGPPGFLEPFFFKQRPVILNAPEGEVSQEQAGQDDPRPEKQDDSPALMHRAFHSTPKRSVAPA